MAALNGPATVGAASPSPEAVAPAAAAAGPAFCSPLPQEVTLRHFELWRESVEAGRPVVELEAQDGGEADCYVLTVIGPERKNLLADLTGFLARAGLETVSARIFTLPNESIMDMFHLRDGGGVLRNDVRTEQIYDGLMRMISGEGSGNKKGRTGTLEEIAGRGGGGGDVGRMTRCASNIAVFDLDDTLAAQRLQAASHRFDGSQDQSGGLSVGVARKVIGAPVTGLQTRGSPGRFFPPDYPPVDLSALVRGEWLLYYSSKSLTRYRFKFRLSEDHTMLLWDSGRSLKLSTCVGVVFGPKSSVFKRLDKTSLRRDQDWLCMSIVSFPKSHREGTPTTVDLVCESDGQLTSWLFGIQRLCGTSENPASAPYSYEAILRQRFIYKLTANAHDRGLTVRQYFLRRVTKAGEGFSREKEMSMRDSELHELEERADRLRDALRKANARETVLATKLHTMQADWDIDFSELSLSHAVGRGAYSEMWKGSWRGGAVAVKVLKAPDHSAGGAGAGDAGGSGSDEHRHLHDFHDEVVVISKLRHPNITLFMAACAHPPNLCIVTEFCHGGNLFSALRRPTWRENIKHNELVCMARDIARGMHYLHCANLIHRDLKSQNILLDRPVENGCPTLKIADFGLSRDFHGGSHRGTMEESVAAVMTSETGTYRYMSPNVIRHEPYNAKADVYSYAVTVWEMFSCEVPFAGLSPIQAAFAVADKGQRPAAVSAHARANPLPPAWQVLVENCWDEDPHVRPRFLEIIEVLDEMEKHGPLIKPPYWARRERAKLPSLSGKKEAVGGKKTALDDIPEALRASMGLPSQNVAKAPVSGEVTRAAVPTAEAPSASSAAPAASESVLATGNEPLSLPVVTVDAPKRTINLMSGLKKTGMSTSGSAPSLTKLNGSR